MTFKNTPNLLLLLFAIGVLFSCKSTGSIPLASTNTVKTVTVTEVVHDTILKTEKDSSYYRAYIKCKDGKPVIENVEAEKPGKNMPAPTVNLKDNQLEVGCEAKAHELFLTWKSKQRQEVIVTETKIPYPVERELTFFQKLFIRLGQLFLGILLALGAYWILKIKNIIKI